MPIKLTFLKDMFNNYVIDAKEIMVNFKRALSENDDELFIRSAHTLKSSSANVGAMKISIMSEEMEKTGSGESFNKISDEIEKLKTEFESVKKALEKYLN